MIEPKTYTTRRAAIAGARRAVAEVVKDAMCGVHFDVRCLGTDAWTWVPIDHRLAGMVAGVSAATIPAAAEPVPPPAPAAEEPPPAAPAERLRASVAEAVAEVEAAQGPTPAATPAPARAVRAVAPAEAG